MNEEDRMVIFATDEGLQHLSNSSSWYMDGNFGLAPKDFLQLYVVRVKIQKTFITSIYCLLKNKNQKTYEKMLTKILEKCSERQLYPDPTSFHVDFEKSVINAVKSVLGEHVCINGCFYHLTQSTHRMIQKLGLEQIYREDESFSEFCRKLDGLAFLPLEMVKDGMAHLKNIMPDHANDLVDYFDKTYVNGTYRQIGIPGETNIRFRNCPPLFPLEQWNTHDLTLEDSDRTNNQTEGWNNRFSRLVGHKHPSIWVLITKMRLEVATDETKLAQQSLGLLSNKRKLPHYEKNQKLLKNLCLEIKEGNKSLPEFLTAIVHTIRFY